MIACFVNNGLACGGSDPGAEGEVRDGSMMFFWAWKRPGLVGVP